MNNWETVSFENAPLEIIDGDRGVNYPKQSDFMASGYCLFLNAGNVTEIGFDFSDCSFISEAKDNKLRKGKLARHDIVLTTRGTVGNLAYYDDRIPFENIRLNSGMVIIRPDKESIFPRYLYFLLKSSIFSEQVSAFTTGSAQPQLPIRDIKRIEFFLPPLPEQRAIAGILGALDDKIELNRRMNRTLESMARAVFRELMKEERGKETTVGEVVTVVGGSTPSTTNPAFWDGGNIHWATPKDLAPLQSPFLLETNSWITELGLQEISSGLLPVGTVLLSSRAPIGYLAITQIPVAINQGFIAIKCNEEVPNYFILNWLKENMEEIIGRANGTTFLEISKSNFRPMKINVPSPEKMNMFVETVQPLYQKIVANLKESRTLASLRDSLLPKLMRGEVRVK
ncbi:MAG: restriction endonuclease subunit S [Chloroflexi bacterium]|nr:restriction endonuclease subunit S [Chloroflexota bacterium]